MKFDYTWVGPADTPEGNWIRPSTAIKGDPPEWANATTSIGFEKPVPVSSPEAWRKWQAPGAMYSYAGIPFMGRFTSHYRLVPRHPAYRNAHSLAVPFYAPGPVHDERWIGDHDNLFPARWLQARGFNIIAVLRPTRPTRPDREFPWEGQPVPLDTLEMHAEQLRKYGFQIGVWEGDPKNFEHATRLVS